MKFLWDDQNVRHLGLHNIQPREAEQVILNRPLDLEFQLRSGEQRLVQLGETDVGTILLLLAPP